MTDRMPTTEDAVRLPLRDELMDTEHEVAAFLHPFIWGLAHQHDTEPGDGSDCHECYEQTDRLFRVISEPDR